MHGVHAGYLPPAADLEFYDPAQHGPELSRGFPGLRVWLTIKIFGAARLRAAIAEKRALAVAAAERLAGEPGIALVAPPQLSLFAFRLEPPGASPAARDDATRRLLERVNSRGRVMLTGCTVDGRFLARICVLSFRTPPQPCRDRRGSDHRGSGSHPRRGNNLARPESESDRSRRASTSRYDTDRSRQGFLRGSPSQATNRKRTPFRHVVLGR